MVACLGVILLHFFVLGGFFIKEGYSSAKKFQDLLQYKLD